MNIRTLTLVALVAVELGSATAQDFNKAGRSAMQFIKIGVGARQTAVGEASIALVRDANATFWNPAAIAGVTGVEASFSYNRWIGDLKYYAAAAGFRVPDIGIFGVSFGSLNYGKIQEALVRSSGTSSDTRTGGTFTGKDMLVGLSYAREFSDRLSVGITAKYLQEKLFIYSSDMFAFDVGTFYDTGFNGIRFGMSFQNFGKAVKFLDEGDREEGYDVPLLFRVGVAADLLGPEGAFVSVGNGHRMTLAFEALNTNDYGERYHVGGEYTLLDFLVLRGGYRFNYAEGKVSFGAGVQQVVSGLNVRFDYSYVSYEFLNSPHRLTLTIGY
jgi:hypothetical protein